MPKEPQAETSGSQRLTGAIISDGGALIDQLDAEGGAWFALHVLELLQLLEADGWQFIPPGKVTLPPDLERVLRDPSITIAKDHETTLPDGRTLFEHLQEWRNAPSNTASAD